MSEPGTDVVPFGKHKGKPVEVMLADPGYREWLLSQPWVRERYPTFHQTIINVGGEPAETPEHNQMQAAFLDDGRCLALARLLLPKTALDGSQALRELGQRRDAERYRQFEQHVEADWTDPRIWGRKFEANGWDVVFKVEPPSLGLVLTSLPDCPCECNHDRDCPGRSTCRGGDDEYGCRHPHSEKRFAPTLEWWENASESERTEARAGARREAYGYLSNTHCNEDCPWRDAKAALWLLDDEERLYEADSQAVHVECKPDLGDDFPAVLRQVTRYDAGRSGDRVCVLVRRHAFEQVSWEQVTEIFRASGIALVREALLDNDADGAAK